MGNYSTAYNLGDYVHGVSGNGLLVSGIIEKILISAYMTEYYVRDETNKKLYKIYENKMIYTDK